MVSNVSNTRRGGEQVGRKREVVDLSNFLLNLVKIFNLSNHFLKKKLNSLIYINWY